jgi:predicted MFS family arabinose efflux permease
VITGLASEAFDRLWQVRLLDDFILPAFFGRPSAGTWFAAVALVGSVISLISSLVGGRLGVGRLGERHPARVLAVSAAVDVIGILGVALSESLWVALAAVWLKGAAAVVAAPVLAVWLNRQLPSKIRATALSIDSQANAVGQVVGGPPLGGLATVTSPRTALVTAGLIITPVIVIFALLDRGSAESPPDQASAG